MMCMNFDQFGVGPPGKVHGTSTHTGPAGMSSYSCVFKDAKLKLQLLKKITIQLSGFVFFQLFE